MSCKGLHCPGCRDGGGGSGLVALVLVAGLGLAAAGGVYAGVEIPVRMLETRARRTVPARAQVIRLSETPTSIGPAVGRAIEVQRPREVSRTGERHQAADWCEAARRLADALTPARHQRRGDLK